MLRLRMKLTLLLLSLSTSISSPVMAALQHADWITQGDSAITLDTTTGYEWLKLDNTSGKSVNDIISNLGSDGHYAGWRLPTDAEVEALLKQIMPALSFKVDVTTMTGSSLITYTETWRQWMGTSLYKTTGIEDNGSQHWYSYGLYIGDSGKVEMTGTYTERATSYSSTKLYNNIYDDYNHSEFNLDFKSSHYSVFLVSSGGMIFDPDKNVLLPPTQPVTPEPVNPPNDVPISGLGWLGIVWGLTMFMRTRSSTTIQRPFRSS